MSKPAVFLSALLGVFLFFLAAGRGGALLAEEGVGVRPELLTVAERSGYRATARHEEVVELSRRLAESSSRITYRELGRSHEGRPIPLLLVARSPVEAPRDVEASGRLLVLAFGGIHGGEVSGKEALLMLARELGAGDGHPLLETLVLALVPALNADGGDRISRENRPRQVGPAEGVGERRNAQGLDLNRDWVKLEAPETRALVRFSERWDPLAVIDTHTTNGSRHRYAVTYAGPKHSAGDARLIEFVRDRFLPAVGERLEEETGLRTFFYGNFAEHRTLWTTYPDLPRYGTPYRGLRNRVAILSEAYAYDGYKRRVLATRDFVRACLEELAGRAVEVRRVVREADAAARDGSAGEVALRTRAVPFEEKVTVLGYARKAGKTADGEADVPLEPRDLEVALVNDFVPVVSTGRPRAYLYPASLTAVTANLLRHGIRVEELREDIELDLEVDRIEEIERADRAFEGHHLVRLETSRRTETRMVPAGSVIVPMGQRLSTLAVYLLEPLSEDGLCAWNFLDGRLEEESDYPVVRITSEFPLATARLPSAGEPREKKPITFEVLYGSEDPPELGGSPVRVRGWLDPDHYLQVKEGRLWKVEAATGRPSPFVDAEALADALARLPGIDEETASRLSRGTSFHEDPARKAALFEHGRDLYRATFDGESAARLTATPEEEELATFSPDGRFVAFVRENDLWVVDVETRTERALTSGGHDLLRRGKASWVYFEEVFDRDWQCYWWSPDSRRIAYLETDSSGVKQFTIVHNRPDRQEVERSPYPKPGEPNPAVRLGIVPVAGGETRWVDLSRDYDPADLLVTGAGWWPAGDRLWFYAQNRTQSRLDFCSVDVDAEGGKDLPVRRLFRQTTGAWVDQPLGPFFLEGGSFLLTSERTGWRHLCRFGKDGALQETVTRGEWEVRGVEEVDEETGWVYITATRDSHVAVNLYRVRLDGSRLERLTREEGFHRPLVAPGGRRFLSSWSTVSRPTRTALFTAAGERLRTVDSNPTPDLEEHIWCEEELFEIETSDGFRLPASLIRPPDFDPARRYPVWFTTYGGPHYPVVRNAWSYRSGWRQALAQSGIVVFRLDPRSASGRGAVSAWTCYRRLGAKELEDIARAIEWLRKEPWVDPERIGMSGHSYGGFLTAYAMTHSDLFAAGIAGAPVTDWRDYDTIYTERYMLTPRENPEGYRETSVVDAAGNLHGRLLLLHGTMDDNVHLQNTLKLVDRLQEAGKTSFELMIYPGRRHGLHGKHYRRLVWEFIRRTVGEESSTYAGEEREETRQAP